MKQKSKMHDEVMPSFSLSELCSEAAEHVAKARRSLFNECYDAEVALLHLDEAIFCLKRLLAHGRSAGINGTSANGTHIQLHSA
ncbi:MAG: hypothetical protein FJX44_02585 [Alphaproteobacteria bacterium]|nr:hypothetical protein [Alphaproteobacteria bacterium]